MKKKIEFENIKKELGIKEYSLNNNYHKILCTFKQVKGEIRYNNCEWKIWQYTNLILIIHVCKSILFMKFQ